ncbi:hypothetical protein CQA81_31640, partial [Klebsiella pneumoniae]
ISIRRGSAHAARHPRDIAAYLELHIERGAGAWSRRGWRSAWWISIRRGSAHAARHPRDIAAYLELHIERGAGAW